MMQLPRLDRRGAAAGEFALTVPLAVIIIFTSVQLGTIAWANAGLQNGIGAAARTATLWPRRTDAEIKARLLNDAFGIEADKLATPKLVRGTADGRDYVDITVNYQTTLNFIAFKLDGIDLSHTRRAYFP